MMERLRTLEQQNLRRGLSLKELLPYAIESRQGKPGPPVSERVLWLAQQMETENFWLALNQHMAEDTREKVHSVGGVFFREQEDKQVGHHPYTWYQLFVSLDHFLKGFDMRATEFIFRDFEPENSDRNLARLIDATRELALNRYPRLRRLYWEDYQEILQTPAFWRNLALDLVNLRKPTSVSSFFGLPKLTRGEEAETKNVKTVLQRTFRRAYWLSQGRLGRRACFIEYWNLTQIIRHLFNQDPKSFLLGYEPKSQDMVLLEEIKRTKNLLEEKVLPTRPQSEPLMKMSKAELNEIIEDPDFWLSFISDIENHANSQSQAYSLSNFLRFYSREKNEVYYGKPGIYARLITVYMRELHRLKRRAIRPSQKLVHLLMWEFKPREEVVPLVLRAKALCAEMFPQDCLYVILQTSEFWEEFEKDVASMQGRHNLYSFLRYFSHDNPTCDRRYHRTGISKYQRLLYRAYHKQKEFLKFLSQLGIDNIADYKDGLAKLFWQTAPEDLRHLLLERLLHNFKPKDQQRQLREQRLLSEAKRVILELRSGGEQQILLKFRRKKEAIRFRAKLWSATRTLNIPITTELQDECITVRIGKRKRFSPREMVTLIRGVEELRAKGWKNKEIAQHLGVEDYSVKYAVRKLIAARKINPRRKKASQDPRNLFK
jgi:hypothetical protein